MFSEQKGMGQEADSYMNNPDIAWRPWLENRNQRSTPKLPECSGGILATLRLRQEDLKYKANLSNTVKPSLKKQSKTNTKTAQSHRKTN